jgi:hypothetical protein
MSITNPLTITTKLASLFNLLGVVVTIQHPVTQKDDYGYNVTTSLESSTVKVLPYNQGSEALLQLGIGDIDTGKQYFAIQVGNTVVINDIVDYQNEYYLVEGITDYSWGESIMKALRTSKMTPPFPPYLLAGESGESNSS